MRAVLLTAALTATVVAAVTGCLATEAPRTTGEGGVDVVERVVDGDTVHLRDTGRARLIGVDTPEVYGGVECFGREASRALKRLLPPGTRVRVERDVEAADRYDRALVYLWRGERFVNAALVEQGFAVPLTIPPNVEHADRFVRLARQAREADRGLWSPATCGGDDDRPA